MMLIALLTIAFASPLSHAASSAANNDGTTYPVHIVAIDGYPGNAVGTTLPSSVVQILVSDTSSGTIVYSGQMPPGATINLPIGRYSFYAQSPEVGFNATLASVAGPTTVSILLAPYRE